jgi:hypothetical protein
MKIKTFKLFESSSENSFPDLDEIKSYFYDFTDEMNTLIDDYEFGYIFFRNRDNVYGIKDYKESDYIDILNTELSNTRLDYTSDFIKLNRDGKKTHKNLIKLIESGEEPGYEYIFIHFDGSLFQKDKLSILTECIETIYSHTGFRPVKSLWTEDYIDDTGEVETLYGFEGTFVRVKDEEYKKLCDIFVQGNFTPIITKLFQ